MAITHSQRTLFMLNGSLAEFSHRRFTAPLIRRLQDVLEIIHSSGTSPIIKALNLVPELSRNSDSSKLCQLFWYCFSLIFQFHNAMGREINWNLLQEISRNRDSRNRVYFEVFHNGSLSVGRDSSSMTQRHSCQVDVIWEAVQWWCPDKYTFHWNTLAVSNSHVA